MSLFKHKSHDRKIIANFRTIDEIHQCKLLQFKKQLELLPIRKTKLKNLIEQLHNLNKSKIYTVETIAKKSILKDKIKYLKSLINNTENNSDIMNYLGTTGNILFDYFDITFGSKYNIPKSYYKNENLEDTNTIPKNLKILEQLTQHMKKIKKPVKKRKISPDIKAKKSILDFIEIKKSNPSNQTKLELQNNYLLITDKTYACSKVKKIKSYFCEKCNIEKILCPSDSYYVCPKCGEVENIIVESENINHKDSSDSKPKYPYKKINHLKEKLAQFQAKETADIPDSVYDIVDLELKKNRLNPDEITFNDIRIILKKYKLTDHYEHLQQIYCRVSGKLPVSLSKETEEKIINMFLSIQDPFRKFCPSNRSNFLNYFYVLNKIFRIIGLEIYADYWPLLKSKDKLREQDIIWNKICNQMKWEFHSSFNM